MTRAYVCMGCGRHNAVERDVVHMNTCCGALVLLCQGSPGSWRPVGHSSFDRRGITLNQMQIEGDGCRRIGPGWRQ